MEFSGKDIKALRKVLGLNQTQFAEKLGVTKLSVINWELGRTEIKKESVRVEIQRLMEQNNLANAEDISVGVEITGENYDGKLTQIYLPHEAFEPRIFLSVFDTFLANQDISDEDKDFVLRRTQRIYLDFLDDPSSSEFKVRHIWPDTYINKRKTFYIIDDDNDIETDSDTLQEFINSLYEEYSEPSDMEKLINEVGNKIRDGQITVEQIFNFAYLPSYIDTEDFCHKMNFRCIQRKGVSNLYQLSLAIIRRVMSYQNIYGIQNGNNGEIDTFIEDFCEQIGNYGLSVFEIRKMLFECGYLNHKNLDELIGSGQARVIDFILTAQFIEENLLDSNDINTLEDKLVNSDIKSWNEFVKTQNKMITNSYLKNRTSPVNVVTAWIDSDFELEDLFNYLSEKESTKEQILNIQIACYVYVLISEGYTLSSAYDKVLNIMSDINSLEHSMHMCTSAYTDMFIKIYYTSSDVIINNNKMLTMLRKNTAAVSAAAVVG